MNSGSIKFRCPGCEKTISTSRAHIGTNAVCPACSTPLVVPQGINWLEKLNGALYGIEPSLPVAVRDTSNFDCPSCGQYISATLSDARKVTNCPTCGNFLVVPDAPNLARFSKRSDPKEVCDLCSTGIEDSLSRVPAEQFRVAILGGLLPPRSEYQMATGTDLSEDQLNSTKLK